MRATIDPAKMPEPAPFAYGALVKAMSMAPHWRDARMVAGEIQRVVTVSHNPMSWHTWVWDHNGAGDFVRMSNCDFCKRLLVVFNHESDRSPWGNEDEELAPGFEPEVLGDYELRIMKQTDLFASAKPVSMTEAYIRRSTSILDKTVEWYTTTDIALLDKNHSLHGHLNGVDKRFTDFYDRLMTGDPSLREFCSVLNSDLAGAAAFTTADTIRQWLAEPYGLSEDR